MNALKEENQNEIDNQVLFVDDEPLILFSIRRFLKQHKIEIDVETDVFKAIEKIKEKKYKVIISDFKMPVLDGGKFFELAREVSPDSIRVILSAQITQDSLQDLVNHGEIYRCLKKPWKEKDLLKTLEDSVHKFDKHNLKTIIEAPKNIPTIKDTSVEEDKFIENILPPIHIEKDDTKKLLEIFRNEEHQHLIYIMNLVSSKIALHCKRVSQLSAYMARSLNLSDQEVKDIYYAGLYHDIGKLFEYAAMVDHAEASSNILNQFHELKGAAILVRDHHKRADSSGYDSVPIGSKIISIVDYFDKEINKEIDSDLGEKKRTLTDILATMKQESGAKFDKDLLFQFSEIVIKDFKLENFFNETKLHITELREGMILSRPMFNVTGKMLLNSEYKMTKEIIGRIFKHNAVCEVKNPVFVYSKSPDKVFHFEEFIAKKIKIS